MPMPLHEVKMDRPPPNQTSAQVVLRPVGNDRLESADYVASEISRFAPDPSVAAAAAQGFAEIGFTTGPMVGNSFSIEGPSALFQQIFGAVPDVASGTPGGTELALHQLPGPLIRAKEGDTRVITERDRRQRLDEIRERERSDRGGGRGRGRGRRGRGGIGNDACQGRKNRLRPSGCSQQQRCGNE